MARAGLGAYLKSAFLTRWNLLFFLGAAVAALISPWPDALLPLLAAGELTYLAGLVSRPRFRDAIDARIAASGRMPSRSVDGGQQASVSELLPNLSPSARERFTKLRARCLEMQRIARGAQGKIGSKDSKERDLQTPALDRLLWMFLRLLVAEQALDRFMQSTDEGELASQVAKTKARLEKAEGAADERMTASLKDSLGVAQVRLANYHQAVENADFMDVELDRVEQKIQALVEMAVIRQDPDFLTLQVDAAVESMRHTETAIRELQSITGLTNVLAEVPPILHADLRDIVGTEA